VTIAAPANAHHSFSIFDGSVTRVFTGVVTRVNPDANHLQIFFAPMNDERKNVIRDDSGKPVVWAVEMAGSAQSARQGVSVSTFPPGTIFSVAPCIRCAAASLPEAVKAAMFKCPERTPPAPGMHCDSVEGHTRYGDGELPTPSE
jgi:hypothetical protein